MYILNIWYVLGGQNNDKKALITIRIETKLKNKLEKLADYDKRTLSDYIRITLENLVESENNLEILSKLKKSKDIVK